MYSEKVEKVLKGLGIEVGDTISIENGSMKIEGSVMPKTEAGDPDTIIIKLKGGYNAGIMYNEKVKLKKLESGKGGEKFPYAKPEISKNLPKVTILWTGGTIGSKVDYKTGGVNTTITPEELFYYVPELTGIANIELKHLFMIWSEDMSYHEWQKIAEETAKALNNGSHGIVIAHGTDTMHYTASALSFMLKNLNAPVILTGSQRSSDRGSSDAFLNLISAVRLAANSDFSGVGICMHASGSDDKQMLIRGVKARKMHASRRDAFRPINDKPIAYVKHNGDIEYVGDYTKIDKRNKEKVEAHIKFNQMIALIKVYPNSDPEILEYYMEKGYLGFVLEGTGLGHAPVSTEHEGKSWLPCIKSAIDEGAVVAMTSQTIYGRVHASVYKTARLLSGVGVIYCEDMTPETAYVKLGWLIANYKLDEVKKLMPKNLVGEIKDRINYDEFLV